MPICFGQRDSARTRQAFPAVDHLFTAFSRTKVGERYPSQCKAAVNELMLQREQETRLVLLGQPRERRT